MSASQTATASLDAYAAWEPQLQAFAWCDPELVLSKAAELDARPPAPGEHLRGVPVGIKDVFDTAGVPTEYGSAIFAGRLPEASALAVRRLESAGAVVFGKTVTAEMAYYAPGPTTNPWKRDRTPGGSSMGSAAAVAAGVIPVAIGTQTNGSVIRPAAFCGVVGFKPSFGRIPTAGMLCFSPALDQIGVIAESVSLAAAVAAALAGEHPSNWDPAHQERSGPVLGVLRTPEWAEAEPAVRDSFDAAVKAADAAGASLEELELPGEIKETLQLHRVIMAGDANRWIRPRVASRIDLCSPQLREILDEGARVSAGEYAAAREQQALITEHFRRWSSRFDALLCLSALGEAPSLVTTGDPRCCTRWTLTGAPALTLPSGLGPNQLPVAIQLVGSPGEDRRLVTVARWLERLLPEIGAPRPGP